jgi:murein DD-endopeptidase MepM/ murein hydrolase activator NlpD
MSTCLAAAVGAVAIGVVIVGSLDQSVISEGGPTVLERLRKSHAGESWQKPRPIDGLKWSLPKADRLMVAADVPTARHVIHEQVQVRRNNRPFIQNRPYVRIVANLYAQELTTAENIPPFNPLQLYAPPTSEKGGTRRYGTDGSGSVAIKVVELLGGLLPAEDGLEQRDREAMEIVSELMKELDPSLMRRSFQPDGLDAFTRNFAARGENSTEGFVVPARTTVLEKQAPVAEEQAENDLEGKEVRVIRVARGDTLLRIMRRLGAESWQARAMVAAANPLFQENELSIGNEVHVTLVPSLTREGKMEPARFSVFGDGHIHLISVNRNAAGEFSASSTPFDSATLRAALGSQDELQQASLYASVFAAGLQQGLTPEAILKVMQIHASDTDFRRRISAGDRAEWFFDLRDENAEEKDLRELLYTMIQAGGEVNRFWRFRSQDGVVDYYDEFGNNSRKFLMRRPVRGANVRLTSGFGLRFHPILRYARPHKGVDWAGPRGTPILAAGKGIIEFAGRKGEYGNYIRIRHANGYKTAYAHLHRIAPNITVGASVRQAQVIGEMGSTGLSTATHLHYEVLANSRSVDPLSIDVPRERRLAGRDLAEFQRERARIDDLVRRQPFKTISNWIRQASRP